MRLTENEFIVLRALAMGTDISEEIVPAKEAMARATLEERGLLADGKMTEAGREILETFRVKNAIIQAAGICRRLAPISYDIPKGLLEVHGEVLVERQIRQLHEVGITDITMVVGHLAEQYDYIADKFGVKIVYNPDYASFNTMVTIYLVREQIGNTYLVYSDNYITPNPYHVYEWRSFYPTRYDNPTDEWTQLLAEGRNIAEMAKSDHGGEHMQGSAYITRETAAELIPIIEGCYNDPDLRDNYWEHALWLGHGSVHMICELLPHGVVNEFDSMDELEAFDPDYINHVSSPSLDNICRTLGCGYTDIRDCYPLTKDLANPLCHFVVDGVEYAYRHPVGYIKSDEPCDWEAYIESLSRELGFEFVYVGGDNEIGWEIRRLIPRA